MLNLSMLKEIILNLRSTTLLCPLQQKLWHFLSKSDIAKGLTLLLDKAWYEQQQQQQLRDGFWWGYSAERWRGGWALIHNLGR